MAGFAPLFARGGPTGSLQMGVQYESAFTNFLWGLQSLTYPPGVSPQDFDADGLPNKAMFAGTGGSFFMSDGYAPNGRVFVLKVTTGATRSVRCVLNANVTLDTTTLGGGLSSTGAVTVSGGSNSALTATFTGTGKVYFTFNNYSGKECGFYFPSGYTNVSGTGQLALVRLSDEAGYDAGEYWNPEYLAQMREFNLLIARTMGFNQGSGGGSNQVRWSDRTLPSKFSWLTEAYPADIWVSSPSHVLGGTSTAYTCGNASASNPLAYVDGEMLAITWPGTTNGANPTLNRNSLGAKAIVDSYGAPLAAGQIPANTPAVLIFDAILNAFIFTGYAYENTVSYMVLHGNSSGGLSPNIPIEASIQLADRINCDLWFNVPTLWLPAAWNPVGAFMATNLPARLKCYFEYANEVWNTVFYTTSLLYYRGIARGISTGDNRPDHGMFGYTNCKMMPAIVSGWTSTGRSQSQMRRVVPWHAVKAFYYQSTYRFDGADLNSSVCPDGVNHSIAPNRPRDNADVSGCGSYFQGAHFSSYFAIGFGSNSASALQTMARNFALGGSSAATALSALDTDIRSGTVSGGGGLTLADYSGSGCMYEFYENLAIAWAADGNHTQPVTIVHYEGAIQCQPPTVGDCGTLVITADYNGSGLNATGANAALTDLLVAYKNHPTYGYNIALDYCTQAKSFAHTICGTWLLAYGDDTTVYQNPWCATQGGRFSTHFKLWDGLKVLH